MEIIVNADTREFRRVECAIAEIEALPASERIKKHLLLQALQGERARLARSLCGPTPKMRRRTYDPHG
jgi:hypothetical protein